MNEAAISSLMAGAGIVAALVGVVIVVVFVNVFFMLFRRALWSRKASAGRSSFHIFGGRSGFLAAVWRESKAHLWVVTWFVTRTGAGRLSFQPGLPVVLVHGVVADGTAMWALRRTFHAMGRATHSPSLGGPFRPVEAYAARLVPVLAEAIATANDDEKIDVVCHSMGGVVLRVVLRDNPEMAARIGNIVTLAAPHAGTVTADGVPVAEARQLARNSPWLRALPSLRELVPHARITTIASHTDAVVFPHETSRVLGASEHELLDMGHSEMLMSPRVIRLVVDSVA